MQVRSSTDHPAHLRQLLPEAEFLGADDLAVTACTCDVQRVRPGSLFVDLSGSGEASANEAVANGCAAILSERPLPGIGVPVCYVPDAREAYGRLCHALAGYPSRAMKVIGVAGRRGRTVTSCLIAGALHAAGHRVAILGALGSCDGRGVDASFPAQPAADALAPWFAQAAANGCSHAVIEVSSEALDDRRTAGVEFDVVALADLRHDSIGSLDHYRLVKSQLLARLPASAVTILNADDSAAAGYLGGHDGPMLTVGVRSAAQIAGVPIEQMRSEQTFLLSAGADTIPVRTRMAGTTHVTRCLTAAAVGLTCGLSLPAIIRGIEGVDYVPGHLERIECGQPFGVFVDGSQTPEELSAALDTLREVVERRLICVFGAEDCVAAQRPILGRAAEAGADRVVVTTGFDAAEPGAIGDMLEGFRDAARAKVIKSRREAIAWSLANARPGDCVLIAGMSNKPRGSRRERRRIDDRDVIKKYLYESADNLEARN
jgi:UDP-N-acetylmuramoyl-L-alanyl-D-glutamate--2,6-diaminopimelate ligase